MKWYVLTLFLLVGFVWSASAQQVDSRLVGEWETQDGPCSPCTISIQEKGGVKFYQAGSTIEVIAAQVTPEPGVDIILAGGGKLDLSLTKSSKSLVGYYTSATQNLASKQPIVFRHQ
jgi:hypothetical protein